MVVHAHRRRARLIVLLLVLLPLFLAWGYQDTNGIEAAYQQGVAHVNSEKYRIGLGLLDFYLENALDDDKQASAAYYKAKAFRGLNQTGKADAMLRMIVATYPSSLEAALSRCELAGVSD